MALPIKAMNIPEIRLKIEAIPPQGEEESAAAYLDRRARAIEDIKAQYPMYELHDIPEPGPVVDPILPAMTEARRRQRRLAAGMQGRAATILTSPQGVPGEPFEAMRGRLLGL